MCIFLLNAYLSTAKLVGLLKLFQDKPSYLVSLRYYKAYTRHVSGDGLSAVDRPFHLLIIPS
jgi:hypothetical protein